MILRKYLLRARDAVGLIEMFQEALSEHVHSWVPKFEAEPFRIESS